MPDVTDNSLPVVSITTRSAMESSESIRRIDVGSGIRTVGGIRSHFEEAMLPVASVNWTIQVPLDRLAADSNCAGTGVQSAAACALCFHDAWRIAAEEQLKLLVTISANPASDEQSEREAGRIDGGACKHRLESPIRCH